jgi:hypothetical protein
MAGMSSLETVNVSSLLGLSAVTSSEAGSVVMKSSGILVSLPIPSDTVQVSVAGTVGAGVAAEKRAENQARPSF